MGRVICLASAKGGSGKTTLTANLGAFLSGLGKRVLMIDADAATNGLTLLYLHDVLTQRDTEFGNGRRARGLFDASEDDARSLTFVEFGDSLHLLPASYEVTSHEVLPIERLRLLMGPLVAYLRREYDFILIDSEAGVEASTGHIMSSAVSDIVVLVSEYDPLSAAGIERMKALFPQELSYIRAWILLNKVLPEFRESFRDFLEIARYLPPIPWNADVVRAYSRRQLAIDLERGNEFTLAMIETCRILFADELADELDTWLAQRAKSIREPIRERVETLRNEVQILEQDFQEKSTWQPAARGWFVVRRLFDSRLTPIIVLLLSSAALGIGALLADGWLGGVLPAVAITLVFVLIGSMLSLATGRAYASRDDVETQVHLRLRLEKAIHELDRLETIASTGDEGLIRSQLRGDVG